MEDWVVVWWGSKSLMPRRGRVDLFRGWLVCFCRQTVAFLITNNGGYIIRMRRENGREYRVLTSNIPT